MKGTGFKGFTRRKLWRWRVFNKLVLRNKSYLHASGWIQSIKRGYPCDTNGDVIPWMNYPVVNLLKSRLKKDHLLFEYGSGYSTLFYAARVAHATSIEYDLEWFNHIQKQIPENVTLIYKDKDVDGDYCRSIGEQEPLFDVVIIDGRDRVNCLKQAIPKLSPGGVIIFDDSARDRYAQALEYAQSQGFRALDFEGLKPTGFGMHRTTIYYRCDNCLGI